MYKLSAAKAFYFLASHPKIKSIQWPKYFDTIGDYKKYFILNTNSYEFSAHLGRRTSLTIYLFCLDPKFSLDRFFKN